jgi:hypothetical protein
MPCVHKKILSAILMFAVGPFVLFNAHLLAATQPAVTPPATAQSATDQAAESHTAGSSVAKVSQVSVTSDGGGVDVEITTSRPVVMRSQVATDPDRLVLDFTQAVPGTGLHSQLINQGEVKGVRVGLFGQNPPVTRVVIDLKSAQPYRIYPSGKTVTVKLMPGEKQPSAGAPGHLNQVSFTPPVPAKPAPVLEVNFGNGRLSILAHDVSLAQVLNEVQKKTGTDIPVPSMAAQEQIVTNIGPLPIREALTALLNGSRFNFILVGADDDPAKVKSVILTFRSGGVSQPAIAAPPPGPAPAENQPVTDAPQPDVPQPDAQPQPQDGAGQEVPQPQQDNPSPQ